MKAKVYTRGGDKGTTSLVGGTRKVKSDPRIELYGEVDELNAFIGSVLVYKRELPAADQQLLEKLQSILFDLGALLACEADKRSSFKLNTIKEEFVSELEHSIDRLDAQLEPLKSFIMPRGSELVVRLHIARTITRRVERKLVAFEQANPQERVEQGGILLNRLSDYLFTLSRYVMQQQGDDGQTW